MAPQFQSRSVRTPERLAYWYFRLNGFMTVENFLIHPEFGSNIRTDADLLATRFKHRTENVDRPMADDSRIVECDTFANIIIAEIKTGNCALNGPWTEPSRQNMERVLRSIGCVTAKEVDAAASALYRGGKWASECATIRLFAVGDSRDESLDIDPSQQLEWSSIIDFCVGRFKEYKRQKSSNGQWAADGIHLRRLGLRDDTPAIRHYFGLNPEQTDN